MRHQIDSVTRSDAVEIDLDGRILAQLLADNLQMPVTDSLAGPGNFLGRRYLLTAPLRAEPPEVEQRLNGQVQCAVAFLRQLLPSQHELAGGLGHGHALPCREGIEGFDIRIGAVGRQLLVQLGQNRFGLALQLCLGSRTITGNVLHRVGTAHGRATEVFYLVLKQTTRQGCRQGDSDDGLE